jgi:hypothetical protein
MDTFMPKICQELAVQAACFRPAWYFWSAQRNVSLKFDHQHAYMQQVRCARHVPATG